MTEKYDDYPDLGGFSSGSAWSVPSRFLGHSDYSRCERGPWSVRIERYTYDVFLARAYDVCLTTDSYSLGADANTDSKCLLPKVQA